MRVARCYLKDSGVEQVFHVMSRVVDRQKIFGELEKEKFRRVMRQVEGFSGCEVLTYCIMGNHFHILIKVPPKPKAEDVPAAEVFERLGRIYPGEWVDRFRNQIEIYQKAGQRHLIEDHLNKVRKRMYDVSEFMKTLKQRYTQWYNKENSREGTLWEQRLKCYIVEGDTKHIQRVAGYIDLNPVRAGIVDQPEQYKYSGYSEAVFGGKMALIGIQKIYHFQSGQPKKVSVPLEKKGVGKRSFNTYRRYILSKIKADKHLKEFEKKEFDQISNGLLIGSYEFIQNHGVNRLGSGYPKMQETRFILTREGYLFYFRGKRRRVYQKRE